MSEGPVIYRDLCCCGTFRPSCCPPGSLHAWPRAMVETVRWGADWAAQALSSLGSEPWGKATHEVTSALPSLPPWGCSLRAFM